MYLMKSLQMQKVKAQRIKLPPPALFLNAHMYSIYYMVIIFSKEIIIIAALAIQYAHQINKCQNINTEKNIASTSLTEQHCAEPNEPIEVEHYVNAEI